MRARTLRPGFFMNEELARLPLRARLLFAGLWCLADREGRLEDRPDRIRAAVFPYEPKVKISTVISTLERHQFVKRYQCESRRYLCVSRFALYQHPHPKEPASQLPPPPEVTVTGSFPQPCNAAASSGTSGTRPSGSSGSSDPDQDQDQLAPRASRDKSEISDKPAVLLKVVHSVLDEAEAHILAPRDVAEEIKRRAAKAQLRYDGDRVRKALESAIVQRDRRSV